MDIFTTSLTNPRIKTNIIRVIKDVAPLNVADLSQYRQIARSSKRLQHTCQYQNQILEEANEYEEIGRKFKINGHD